MSQENVEILRRALEQGPKDPEAFYAILDPAVEWDTSYQMPDGEVSHGIASVRRYFRSWFGAFEDYSLVPEELIDAGDEVFVLLEERGTGRSGGATAEHRVAQVWTFRNGKVVRYRGFSDRTNALQAAGLSE